mgnify:CR=1 FL=1
MGNFSLAEMSAAEISKLVTSKEVSAHEVAEQAISRIEAHEKDIHAFNQITPDMALSVADALDAKIAAGATAAELGPLAGAPVADDTEPLTS